MGVNCHNLTEKTGDLAGIAAVDDGDDLMLITDQGTIIRTPVKAINEYSRTASGVIVMRLGEGQKIVGFSTVAHEEPQESEEPAEAAATEATEATETAPSETAESTETEE